MGLCNNVKGRIIALIQIEEDGFMYTQYELPYGFDALEPIIDAKTLELHYSKHHATYTAKFNELAEKAGVMDIKICKLLKHLDWIKDETLRNGIRNNGGGFYNHNLYFEELRLEGRHVPTGELAMKIDETFGSFDEFKEKISEVAINQFGSGWAWLSVTKDKKLVISGSQNQDNPLSLGTGNKPIFTIDVWEHAYYLKYKNNRANYVKNIWGIVDWQVVEERYNKYISKCALKERDSKCSGSDRTETEMLKK